MSFSLDRWFLRMQVKALLVLNRRAAALDRVSVMLSSDPDDLYALGTRAHLLAARGDKAGAVEVIERVVAIQPQHAPGWFNLGFLREELGRLDEAEQAFRRAIALDDKFDRAWYGLALCLIRQRRFDDAVVALKRNTQLQPMSPFGWYQLARVHVDRQEPEEAAKIIRHLRKFEPKVAAQLERETGLVQPQS